MASIVAGILLEVFLELWPLNRFFFFRGGGEGGGETWGFGEEVEFGNL